jgi:hypothetical protein
MIYFYIIWFFLNFILYALYIQFSPGMGNIWWRIDQDGNYKFRPQNLLNMIYSSFTPIFWNPELLDLNFIYFTLMSFLLSIIIYYLLY